MTIETKSAIVLVGWLLTLAIVALSLDLSSVRSWSILIAVGLIPPLLLTRLRGSGESSMSEVIQKALGR